MACGCVRSSGLVSGCTGSRTGFYTKSVISTRIETFARVGAVGNGAVEKPISSKQVLKPGNLAVGGKSKANSGKNNPGKDVFWEVVSVIKAQVIAQQGAVNGTAVSAHQGAFINPMVSTYQGIVTETMISAYQGTVNETSV